MADLDQHIWPARRQRVPVDRVAVEVPAIGLVLAHAEVALRPQPRKQAQGQPRIAVGIEHADMPGSLRPADKARREAVNGADDRVGSPRCESLKRKVVGSVEGLQPPLHLGLIDMAVHRDQRRIVKPHHQRRIVLAPVGVDDEAGEIAEDRRCVQSFGKPPRHPGRPDIVGDVPFHVGGRDPEAAAADAVGNPVRRVVAGDQPARGAVGPEDVERLCRHAFFVVPR